MTCGCAGQAHCWLIRDDRESRRVTLLTGTWRARPGPGTLPSGHDSYTGCRAEHDLERRQAPETVPQPGQLSATPSAACCRRSAIPVERVLRKRQADRVLQHPPVIHPPDPLSAELLQPCYLGLHVARSEYPDRDRVAVALWQRGGHC